MKRFFFITGLPRSRSAWLATVLTWGDTMCYHDGFYGCSDVEEFTSKMRSCSSGCVGNADAMNALYQHQLAEEFPDARWVVVVRNLEDASRSCKVAFGWEDPRRCIEVSRQKVGDVVLYRKPMVVEFGKLDAETVMRLATFINPEWQCPRERMDMLMRLNIQIHSDQLKADIKRGVSEDLTARMEQPVVSDANLRYIGLVKELCGDVPGAYQWFLQMAEMAHIWDHVVDGDVVNPAHADRVFENVVIKWHSNPFFSAHSDQLIPAMAEGLKRWRSVDRAGAFAIYRIIPKLIGSIVGWRMVTVGDVDVAVDNLMEEDNIKDNLWEPQ